MTTAAEIVERSGSNPETTKKSVKLLTRAGRPSGSPPPRGPTRMRRPRAQLPDATPVA